MGTLSQLLLYPSATLSQNGYFIPLGTLSQRYFIPATISRRYFIPKWVLHPSVKRFSSRPEIETALPKPDCPFPALPLGLPLPAELGLGYTQWEINNGKWINSESKFQRSKRQMGSIMDGHPSWSSYENSWNWILYEYRMIVKGEIKELTSHDEELKYKTLEILIWSVVNHVIQSHDSITW